MNLILVETGLVSSFIWLGIVLLQWRQPKKVQPQMEGPPSDFL